MASPAFPNRHAPASERAALAGRLVWSRTRALAPVLGAVVAGLLYRWACPPFDATALAWAIPALLLVPARGLGARRAFACGVLFALVMGAGVTGWAYGASRDYFGFGAWTASAFVVLVWLLYGGVQFGLLVAGYAVLAPRTPLALRGLVAGWLWAAAELLRTWLFTGMPWELLGHSQHGWLALIQVADLGGVYAVSFLMALVSVSIGELVAAPTRAAIAPALALAAVALCAALAYGERMLVVHRAPPAEADARTVAVVQANLPSELHWRRIEGERALAAYGRLSRRAGEPLDLIVWPEYATNLYLDRESMARHQLASVAGLARDGLLLGAPRLARPGEARNSAYLLDARGAIAAAYDKRHLVPFAEYDPLSPTAEPSAADGPRFATGGEAEPLAARSMRIGPLICYEVLFPNLVRDLVQRGADVLVNVSNESWLDAGTGAASKQQLSMSVFPAIEARRFLVRAATTGISGFVSPAGEVIATVPYSTAGTARARIGVRDEITPYVRFGAAWLIPVGLLAGAIVLRSGKRGTRVRFADDRRSTPPQE